MSSAPPEAASKRGGMLCLRGDANVAPCAGPRRARRFVLDQAIEIDVSRSGKPWPPLVPPRPILVGASMMARATIVEHLDTLLVFPAARMLTGSRFASLEQHRKPGPPAMSASMSGDPESTPPEVCPATPNRNAD